MGGYTASEESQMVQCLLELQSAALARVQLVSLFQAFLKALIMGVSDSQEKLFNIDQQNIRELI